MSTRCYIGKLEKDGTVRSIYCHHDGYVSHVGVTLAYYYNGKRKVDALLKLGDISSLGDNLGQTRAYARDFGEDLSKPYVDKSEKKFWDPDRMEEWGYLFKNGRWYAARKLWSASGSCARSKILELDENLVESDFDEIDQPEKKAKRAKPRYNKTKAVAEAKSNSSGKAAGFRKSNNKGKTEK